MPLSKFLAALFLLATSFSACNGLSLPGKGSANTPAAGSAAGPASGSTPSAGSSDNASSASVDQLIDTTRLKSDLNGMLNSIASGKPDTNLLKVAGKDILSTANRVLSDSGIDKLYGNSNDPAVRSAAEMLKKYRNATGLTPDKLDSLKKAANLLSTN